MSYSTLDRFGGISTTYAHGRGGGPPGGSGLRNVWWPDFGPGCQDFSQQRRSHPNEMIFEKVVEPKHWSTAPKPQAKPEPATTCFRNPAAERVTMLPSGFEADRKIAAHAVTEKQAAIRRLELRQQRMDSWLEKAPIHTSAYLAVADKADRADWPKPPRSKGALGNSLSEPALGNTGNTNISSLSAATVSRDVYQKHGYLVGRSQGSIADGRSGATARKHTPLSLQKMMLSRSTQDSKASTSRRTGPRKPSGQWKVCPENSFRFDPQSFLPVPRGGWGKHELSLTDWPETVNMGNREFT
eukprot:CAMPEP_0115603746 /NCGR_PEP_ID=MMETSP0272-20121206/16586_1 /TAXON_ID=71861 /ORGANISM="Scrippsiella trochoidea, Strain CCMP3099" /LENGTH=298 /DNA_ID=CAMNT_0003039277 /DNA_START=77 /DNA_END=969 /DNA_ORIENTATION=-